MKAGLIIATLSLTAVTAAYKSVKKEATVEESKQSKLLAAPANDTFTINFNPYPPNELEKNATPQQLVEFAWEEFLALNWQSSYSKNKKRDMPDLSWNFSNKNPDTLVWETYAHRSELQPYYGGIMDFDLPPHYSYGKKPKPANPNTSFTLFDALDENNEIGSCNLYAHTITEKKKLQVLYQAKVNREEYDYIKNNYGTKALLTAARNINMLNLKQYGSYSKDTCNCLDETYKGISLPCGSNLPGKKRQGAIEIKTAWRMLKAGEDASKFLTRNVIVFSGDTNNVTYLNKTYALIGLHIIHKTRNYEDFVFATWEQVDVKKDNMGYKLLGKYEKDTVISNFSRFVSIPAIVDSSTSFVHRKIREKNPKSVWLNYRLVGVQGNPTNNSNSFGYFLANYVVESDPTLQDFHGSGIGKPHDHQSNIYYKGEAITMGGCQGCHGVAQKVEGADLSFLLDNFEKPIRFPDLEKFSTNKLQRRLKAQNQ
jgi:hypothetical protein